MNRVANSNANRGSTDDRHDDEASNTGCEEFGLDVVRETVGFAAHRLLKIEVGALTVATHGEKNALRPALRNGYRDREW